MNIIFDIDDTLYHRQDPFILAIDKLFPGRIDAAPDILYKTFLKHGNALFEDSMSGRISVEEMRIRRIQLALEEFQVTITDQQALDFQNAYLWEQEHLKLHPAYKEMFDCCCRNGISLGVITNGPSSHQRVKFYAMGLDQWIPQEWVIASGDVGINKPAVGIFNIAAEKWNLDLAQTYYVGDSYEHDILSSKSVGWKTIWLDRNRHSLDGKHSAADFAAHTETELSDLIRNLAEGHL